MKKFLFPLYIFLLFIAAICFIWISAGIFVDKAGWPKHSYDAQIVGIDPCVEVWERYDNYFWENYQDTTYGWSYAATGIVPKEYPNTWWTWSENGDENKSGSWSRVSASGVTDIWVCVNFSFDFDDDPMWHASDMVKMFFDFSDPMTHKILNKDNVKITITF